MIREEIRHLAKGKVQISWMQDFRAPSMVSLAGAIPLPPSFETTPSPVDARSRKPDLPFRDPRPTA